MKESKKSKSTSKTVNQATAKYQAFIAEHTGAELAKKKPREKIDTLAKASTAYMMMMSGAKTFNENVINRKADKIKQTLDLDDLHEVQIDKMISSPEKLKRGVNHQLEALYAPKTDLKEYVDQMKVLADNMPMDDSRSAAYNTMAKCIKDVAAIKPGETSKDMIVVKNYKLMASIENNIKGKERVRRTAAGKDHFNTSLDALSIMNSHNTELNSKTNSIIDKINYARGSSVASHRDHVAIDTFGAARSIEAKKARKVREKEKRLEKTLDKDKLKKKQMERPTLSMR